MAELRCSRESEAAVYIAMDPLPVLETSGVRCPVCLALGGQAEGLHARLLGAGEGVHQQLKLCRLER